MKGALRADSTTYFKGNSSLCLFVQEFKFILFCDKSSQAERRATTEPAVVKFFFSSSPPPPFLDDIRHVCQIPSALLPTKNSEVESLD